jgi:hypothetical protein
MGNCTERRHDPSAEEVRLVLGPAYPLWERLTRFIEADRGSAGEWSTWGPANFGWGLRYRSRGKALAALYPQEGWIIAQIVLGKAQAERALGLELGGQASRVLREAPQLRDGRWHSIPVRDELDAGDVEQLLLVKMLPAGRAT